MVLDREIILRHLLPLSIMASLAFAFTASAGTYEPPAEEFFVSALFDKNDKFAPKLHIYGSPRNCHAPRCSAKIVSHCKPNSTGISSLAFFEDHYLTRKSDFDDTPLTDAIVVTLNSSADDPVRVGSVRGHPSDYDRFGPVLEAWPKVVLGYSDTHINNWKTLAVRFYAGGGEFLTMMERGFAVALQGETMTGDDGYSFEFSTIYPVLVNDQNKDEVFAFLEACSKLQQD